jgi:hypothetical protein
VAFKATGLQNGLDRFQKIHWFGGSAFLIGMQQSEGTEQTDQPDCDGQAFENQGKMRLHIEPVLSGRIVIPL